MRHVFWQKCYLVILGIFLNIPGQHCLAKIDYRAGIFGLASLETDANEAAHTVREVDTKEFDLPYLEVPLSAITLFESREFLPEEVRSHFVFEKGGVPFFRWVIHPKDTQFKDKIIKGFEDLGISTDLKYGFFRGRYTSSRSIAVQPIGFENSRWQLTVKVSTNFAGGHFSPKRPVYGDAAELAVRNSHFLSRISSQVGNDLALEILPEPLGAGVHMPDGSNFGMIVRLYDYAEDEIYIPGFSLLHSELAPLLANFHNEDVIDFVRKFYIQRVGRANAELWAYYALLQLSAHSQQYLAKAKLRPDGTLRLTGKMALRDPNDVGLDHLILESYLQNIGIHPSLEYHFESGIFSGPLAPANPVGMYGRNMLFGPFHGTPLPAWLGNADELLKLSWDQAYLDQVRNTISHTMEIAPEEVLLRSQASLWPSNSDSNPFDVNYFEPKLVGLGGTGFQTMQAVATRRAPLPAPQEVADSIQVSGANCAYLLRPKKGEFGWEGPDGELLDY